MSEQETFGVEIESDNSVEQELWTALGTLPREEPSSDMRRLFYRNLEQATLRHWSAKIPRWFGINGHRGWLTAAACTLIGLVLGQFLDGSDSGGSVRLAALEENVAVLNRELILDRLQDSSAGQRLRAVVDAEQFVQEDREIARALLTRATEDRVQSVRSAAISALGPSLSSDEVSQELINVLENSDSPLVQLELVDLMLRSGNAAQLNYLLQLASSDKLHADLIRHVNISLGRETI